MASVIPQVLTSATADGRDIIQGSTRFSKDKLTYLQRIQSVNEGNSRCWTFSAWVRRNIHEDASWQGMYGAGSTSTNRDVVRFTNTDNLEFQLIAGGASYNLTSTARFTDVTSWYHVVAIWDSGNATQGDRMRIYCNGERITALDSSPAVAQDHQSPTCNGHNTWVGARTSDGSSPSLYFDGYMSEVYLVDGAAIEPSAFGFEDRVTKNWCPKKYNMPGINDGTVWSSYLSANTGTLGNPTYAFNGNQSNFVELANEGIITFTPPTPIRYRKSVKVWLRTAQHKARVNGGEWVFNTGASVEGKYLELPGSGEVQTIDVQYTNSSSSAINMIAIDDEVLIDSFYGHLGTHGFYLPLDGSDGLGKDQSGARNHYNQPANDYCCFGATAPVDIAAKAHGCNPILKTGTGRNPVAGEVNLDDGPNTIPIVRDSGAVHFKGVSGSYTDDHIRLENDGGDLAELGNGDFTIECFVYIEDFNGERHYPIIQKGNSDNNNQYDWRLYYGDNESENLYFQFADNGDNVYIDCGNAWITCGKWHHIVVTRSGTASNNVKVYVDGKLAGQDSAGSDTVQNTYSEIQIGRSNLGSTGETYFQGWISNLRIVEGTALYTGTSTTVRNFPEPEKKLTAVSGTRILACQDPDSPTIDNSGITVTPTLTAQGGPPASTDNPFGNATTGSVSFTSSSSQKIYAADHQRYYIGKNDATVEFWIKTSTPTQGQYFCGQFSDRNLNATVDTNGNVQVFYDDSSGTVSFSFTDLTLTANTWHHYALVRESGYIYAYLDGTKSSLRVQVNDYIKASSSEYAIGQIGNLTGNYTNGLISNFRFVNGKAVYTESFTPPTEDLTAIPGTVLLACQSRTNELTSGAVSRTWGMWGTPYAAPNEVAGSCVLAVPFSGGANKDYSYKINHTSKEKTLTQTGTNLSNDRGIGPLYNQTKDFGGYNDAYWVKTNQSTDFYPNRGCWTIEHWVRRTDSSYNDSWQPHFDLSYSADTYNNVEWMALLSNSDGNLYFYYGTQANGHTNVSLTDIPLNQWCHFAATYDGRKLRLFLNGTLKHTTDFEGTKYNWGGNRAMCIGHQHCCSNNRHISGNMADFRFYNGCCKYREDFTVACASVESTFVLPESPSPVPTAYDLLKPKSGSVHFRRSNNCRLEFRKSYPAAVGTGDCTIECWIWLDTTDTNFPVIYDSRVTGGGDDAGFFLGVNDTGRIYLWENPDTRIYYDVLEKQQWYHIALVRKSSVFTLYVDGESAGNWTSTDNYTNNIRHIGWTENAEAQNWYWDGYISNYRFCTAAVYDGNFKVPTEPLTRTSQGATNCQILCCNDTNYYQKDDALLNPSAGLTITAAGNATHSSDNPFGTSTDGSVVLDGTGDGLQIANGDHINLKDDIDFTVESWLYLTTIDSTLDTWWCGSDYSSSGTTNSINVYLINNGFRIFTRSGGSFQNIFDHSSSNGNGESPLSLNTWHHVAITRSNMVYRVWVDGKQFGPDFSSTVSFDDGQNLLIGGNNYSGSFPEYEMAAKVSNFRVVTGTAIYNSDFDVPTSKLEHIPGTSVLCCQSKTSATATADLNGTVIVPRNWTQVSSHNPFESSAKGHQGNADCYATWNENWKSDDSDLRYGNLMIHSTDNRWGNVFATLGMYPKSQGGAGKYYWETTMYQDNDYVYNGIGDNTIMERNGNGSSWPGQSGHSFSMFHSTASGSGGSITHSGSYETQTGLNCQQWDTMMVAFNADTKQIWFGKNGTWYLGGNPTLGTRHSRLTNLADSTSDNDSNIFYPLSDCYANTSYTTFGQIPFKYTPPEGFGPVSLSRASTAKVGDPQNSFAIRRWTGNYDGSSGNRVIADDLKFKPDLVWIKSWEGNDSRWWSNCDIARGKGAGGAFYRNFLGHTYEQANDGYDVTDISETSTGVASVSVNKLGDYCNANGAEFAMYAFKAGGGTDNQNEHWRDGHKFASAAAAGMTTGTITPHSSSVGTKTGLSIVNYPGNSTDNATLSHGLNQPPNFYMCKELSGVTQGTAGSHWRVGHTWADHLGSGLKEENNVGLYLSLDNAASANSHGAWFTSNLTKEMKHRTGSGNNNQHFHTNMTGFDYIMYMWHDVPGLQKFGSYQASGANGSTNFGIDFGFDPAFVIVKSISSTAKWVVWDCTRKQDSVNWHTLGFGSLHAHDENASGASTNEFYSGGVTFRGSTDRNIAGEYYIYAAWAQKPKFAYNNSSTAWAPGNTNNKTTNNFVLPN